MSSRRTGWSVSGCGSTSPRSCASLTCLPPNQRQAIDCSGAGRLPKDAPFRGEAAWPQAARECKPQQR
jgi:hypothetical protein